MHFDFGLKNYRSQQEYLHTNGLGSFCSGLVSGGRSRRYHGLLCASLNAPIDRYMMVSHFIETVAIKEENWPLSKESYKQKPDTEDLFRPAFRATPFPEWEFSNHQFSLRKQCWMTPEENTTNVVYKNTGKNELKLTIKPLLALRDYHHLRHEVAPIEVTSEKKCLKINSALPSVYLHHSKGEWRLNNLWYHENFYAEEAHRGYDDCEELFNPAEITITLKPGAEFHCQVSLEAKPLSVKKSQTLAEKNYKNFDKYKLPEWGTDCFYAASQCIVQRKSTNTKTILAGYPWFTDWGRDSFISLRSFRYFLSKKDIESIILAFLHYEKNGLIPNRFPDNLDDEIEYNTVDATLWLLVIIGEIFEKKTDKVFLKKIKRPYTKILNHHLAGTDFGIGHDPLTGFLYASHPNTQLTWMDAKVQDKVITPRQGFPVEVQALWYNALKTYQQIYQDDHFESVAVKVEDNFEKYFWNEAQESLNDFLHTNLTPNTQTRPNQIYAVSLPYTLLSESKAQTLLKTITNQLYTPLGLRTLSPEDTDFVGKYEGDVWQRDHAYHQGTVWPFLLADYWRAYEKIKGSTALKTKLESDLKPLLHHFYHDAGINGISEVFDGAFPKHGKGCTHQAWSLAAMVYAAEKLKEA